MSKSGRNGGGSVDCVIVRTTIARFLVEDASIADVSPIQEVQKIDPAAHRQDPDIQTTVEPLVTRLIINSSTNAVVDLNNILAKSSVLRVLVNSASE